MTDLCNNTTLATNTDVTDDTWNMDAFKRILLIHRYCQQFNAAVNDFNNRINQKLLVILLFLSWPQTRCAEDVDAKGEEIFDQLAIASENVMYTLRHSNATSKNLRAHLPSVPSFIDATVRYENSNGFIPIAPPTTDTPSYDEDSNTTNAVSARESSSTDRKKFEDDLAYSSEARIFLNLPGPLTNRRSFDLQESPSEFELLKVNNDTPAVANYREFYENLRGTVNGETDGEPDAGGASAHVNGERGKRVESYMRNYSRQSHQAKNQDPYVRYYSYSDGQDAKKLTYEPEKVPGNHRQQDAANYDGHGQSAVRQNVATVSSSSRTNYGVNGLTHSGTQDGTYDNVAESSRARNKFSRPVVVAEPSDYKVEAKFSGEAENDFKTSRNLESSSSETSSHYDAYNDNRQRSYHRTEDSRNFSDESSDYPDYLERPRRLQNTRRRPDSTRKLPKEHRGTLANSEEQHGYDAFKLRSQRYRAKVNPWGNDAGMNHQDESVEDVRHDTRYDARVSGTEAKITKVHHLSRPKNSNTWSQLSPNLEISHSNGIELDQMEKPKYVLPVKVNFLPVANFDHATALGNSQGFDVSNALLQSMVTASPIGAYTTSAPLLSTASSILGQNLAMSTSVPDIIVGQNSLQNPVHAVVLSQTNGQNKIADTATYLPSTVAPVFALTPSLTPTLQSVRLQNNVTPRTAFAVTPTPTAVVQHLPISGMHAGVQQLIVPQPTVQTFPGFLQTPVHASTEYQIHVNPHGLQGQSLMSQGNLQSVPTTSTLLSNQPEHRIISPAEAHGKKNVYATSGGSVLATASLAVGQNEQKQPSNVNSYYLHNHNAQQVARPQEEVYHVMKGIDLQPKAKTFFQATQVVPTVLQPNPTLSSLAVSTPHYVKLQGTDEAVQQLQFQINRAQLLKNGRLPGDNMVGHSNNANSVNAHLPNVGTKNVEIVNPNIKPSPVDTTVNAFNAMQYPAAVLTTPIPIFSTIGPVTPQTVNLQNYVDSLAETGVKAKPLGTVDLKTSQNQERPVFNPINFVPNVDIIKNQNSLNNKLPSSEPVQQGLNLVPVMPGGNFFRPSYSAQNELILKPKLASDLQQYAEEMFKESLKTMYNSQKWNNDRKPAGNSSSNSESSDLAKLTLELQKLKASLSESKYKDQLVAHQSENNIRTTDPPKSSGDKKKSDALMATLEQLLKNRPSGPIHIYHGAGRPGNHKQKPSGDSSFAFHDEFHDDTHVREFLTPPRPNRFRTKGVFQEKPMKNKRPAAMRFKNGPRKSSGRGHSSARPTGLEASASNINIHLDGSHYHRLPFDDNVDFETRRQPSFDAYPTITTSSPEAFSNILSELRASSNKDYDINHPRIHNLLGLLMKNKQLPSRGAPNNFRDRDHFRQFFDRERRRLQQQFYDDTLKDYILDKFEGASQSGSIVDRKVYSGNGAA
ncbi:PREDICTED: uncharacterized protein LOC106740898 [Dinoponera quadriceps]|uniref:Uncharacterized protein LOC106740898 n=1 Tax=Dinoponera quadriceps TaxID=609295 RepID=A0A6P3WQ05_DINQU|nr:PREDICTED: uncharacterized protein LOC106740898 [Dinoponera quadriceps]